ncbi:hypothetical protein OSL33_23880, partial [Escherichia coli]|nr:hypothetical protein [Escherichia coli]
SAQIREILISESTWEEMTCLFAPSLILRSLAIIPAWFVSLGHEIVTFPFILEIWGNAGDAFSSTSVGNYGFGHYDLNLPQSQLFAGRYGKQTK